MRASEIDKESKRVKSQVNKIILHEWFSMVEHCAWLRKKNWKVGSLLIDENVCRGCDCSFLSVSLQKWKIKYRVQDFRLLVIIFLIRVINFKKTLSSLIFIKSFLLIKIPFIDFSRLIDFLVKTDDNSKKKRKQKTEKKMLDEGGKSSYLFLHHLWNPSPQSSLSLRGSERRKNDEGKKYENPFFSIIRFSFLV